MSVESSVTASGGSASPDRTTVGALRGRAAENGVEKGADGFVNWLIFEDCWFGDPSAMTQDYLFALTGVATKALTLDPTTVIHKNGHLEGVTEPDSLRHIAPAETGTRDAVGRAIEPAGPRPLAQDAGEVAFGCLIILGVLALVVWGAWAGISSVISDQPGGPSLSERCADITDRWNDGAGTFTNGNATDEEVQWATENGCPGW